MEDATFSMPQGMRRGSGILGATILPLNATGEGPQQPRASSYSPNCDVWATAEFGIPLSELNSKRSVSDNNSVKQKSENDSTVS